MRSRYRLLSVFATLLLLGAPALQAQTVQRAAAPAASAQKPQSTNDRIREEWKARLNENVLTLISGNPNGGYLGIAYDIAAVVNNGEELRVLPVVGEGAVQNLRDILFLKGVDMGLVNTVTLRHFKDNGELGTNLQNQITYISMLFQDELHVLARPEINSFKDLEGKRVNFSDKGSGAQLASQKIFAALGMNVKEYNMGQGDAIEMMKRGELDATMCTCLKPLKPHQGVPANLGFKLIPVAYDAKFQDDYLPARLGHDDYPNLVPEGTVVNTIAVPTLLAVYNWPKGTDRYRRIEKFIHAFFSKFEAFKKPPRHPRWKSVNIAGTLPGWTRFPAAQEWLDTNIKAAAQAPRAATMDTSGLLNDKTKAAFEDFLAQYASTTGSKVLPPEQRDALYAQFTKWWATQQPRR